MSSRDEGEMADYVSPKRGTLVERDDAMGIGIDLNPLEGGT